MITQNGIIENKYGLNFKNILNDLFRILSMAGVNYAKEDIYMEDLGVPHCPPKSLPKGKMAVYSFFYKDMTLKIGKAGPKSYPRFTTQHYNAGSAPSTLATSIIKNPNAIKLDILDELQVKDWIKKNTRRINFIINSDLGAYSMNLIEAFLICKFSPIYEGIYNHKKRRI